jgi:hypothetical protein
MAGVVDLHSRHYRIGIIAIINTNATASMPEATRSISQSMFSPPSFDIKNKYLFVSPDNRVVGARIQHQKARARQRLKAQRKPCG